MDCSNVCRVCLTQNNLEMLFEDKNQELLMMLRTFSGISVEPDDCLPRCICIECILNLRTAFNLKAQYQSVYSKLTIRRLVHKTSNATKAVVKECILLNRYFKGGSTEQHESPGATDTDLFGNSDINLVELVPVARKTNHYRIVMMEDVFSNAMSNKTTVYQIFVETKAHTLKERKKLMDRLKPLHTNCMRRIYPPSDRMNQTDSNFASEESSDKANIRVSLANGEKVPNKKNRKGCLSFDAPTNFTSEKQKFSNKAACGDQKTIPQIQSQVCLISEESAPTKRTRRKDQPQRESTVRREMPRSISEEIPTLARKRFKRPRRSKRKYQTVNSKQAPCKRRRTCKPVAGC